MNDVFITYIERKIKEETAKRDAIVLPPIIEPTTEYFHQLRMWWCYEARIQAYNDSLIQYKLTRIDVEKVLDLCLKCNQLTNHLYNEHTGELECLKCKVKK